MAFFDVNPLRSMSRRALGAFVICAALMGCGGGGAECLVSTVGCVVADAFDREDPPPPTDGGPGVLAPGRYFSVRGTSENDTFTIRNDLTGANREIDLMDSVDGLAGTDEVRLESGGHVENIYFFNTRTEPSVLSLRSIEIITIDGGIVDGEIDALNSFSGSVRINLISGTVGGNITGSGGGDTFNIENDVTSSRLNIFGSIDGNVGADEFLLNRGGIVASIAFSEAAPIEGAVHLEDIETITIDGGTVDGEINASNLSIDSVRINLISGTVGGSITGTHRDDTFVIGSGITISGMIDGGAGMDVLRLATGFTAAANLSDNTLTLTLSGGGTRTLRLANIEVFDIQDIAVDGVPLVTFPATAGPNTFTISSDFTSSLTNLINGMRGSDTFVLATGGVVASIAVSNPNPNPTAGEINLVNIETITINGGTVNGNIDAQLAPTAITFNLTSGTIDGDVFGGERDDSFIISGDMVGADRALTINGVIHGDDGIDDFLPPGRVVRGDDVRLVDGAVVDSIAFSSTSPTGGELHLQSIETIFIFGGTVNRGINGPFIDSLLISLISGRVGGNITGSLGDDIFIISGNMVDSTGSRPLAINGFIDGESGLEDDEFRLVDLAVVASIAAFDQFILDPPRPMGGAVHLVDIETITIDGGTVTGDITGNDGVETYNLIIGTIGGNISGEDGNDTFNLYTGINITGYLDGGAGTDVLNYAGATGTDFTARGGLADEDAITDTDGSVRNIESQVAVPEVTSLGAGGAGLRGLTVRGIEVLELSPALNLYGAMSDALMQFGQQTAAGFALADLNLATGRGTQLMSKDSPFSKGRIWAHKITHSGNGKGSIGLNLTGLTARADNDYDYEMSLTQHGFDAPLATTRLGAFNLRAVSHTMTGTIETNVAEANVSGYGAGVALLWRSDSLSAHITSLAGAYEVEAHTSPLNPRAVVSEVSEGSFSAINAVVSAGIADTRKISHSLALRTTADLVWQTLSLDDFSETGADGIAVNFDKATRFTARVGAGLESEHWFSDVVFVHETSSGGTLSSGLSQDYRQDDGTAIEMKLGGKIADLATGLTLKAHIGLRTSLINTAALDPSAHFNLSWRF